MTEARLRVRIVGPGRAGKSFAQALAAGGVDVHLLARNEPVTEAAAEVDAVLIATPDGVIADVASEIATGEGAVLHCSGATGLDALAPHARRGSVHPLMTLPEPKLGAARLGGGGWFAVDGDPIAAQLVDALGGRRFVVTDEQRALYHATAVVSSNHLVALLGQVERLAAQLDVPLQAFLDLAKGALDDVGVHGAAGALTGPAARGDEITLGAHRGALAADEINLYNALVDAAKRLVDPA